jgi:hypothetical protein
LESELERDKVVLQINTQLDTCLKRVIEDLAEKEGRRADKKIIENFMNSYSKDTKNLSFRILDELLIKEQRNPYIKDFDERNIFKVNFCMCC